MGVSAQHVGGLAARALLALLFIGHDRFAAADATAGGFDCQRGCHRAFNPVCGEDGRTYGNACIAACQDAGIAREGACPGEPLLHPDNEHVVALGGTSGDTDTHAASASADAPPPPAAPLPAAAAAAGGLLLTRQHLDAFRHEGFRYAGQMRFTDDMPQRPGHHRLGQDKGQQGAPKGPQQQLQGGGSGGGGGEGGFSFRAVRMTRDGDVYLADLDENVDTVLDTLIRRQRAEEEEEQARQQKQQQQVEPQEQPQDPSQHLLGAVSTWPHHQNQNHHAAQALLHSLQQWRHYRGGRGGGGRGLGLGAGGGGGGVGGGGSKWARHTIITSTSGPMDHALQPVLDASGGGAALGSAAAGFAAEGLASSPPGAGAPAAAVAPSSSSTGTSVATPRTSGPRDEAASSGGSRQLEQERKQQPQQQEQEQQRGKQGEGSGLSWTTRILGGSWADRRGKENDKQRKAKIEEQEKRAGGRQGGGGGGNHAGPQHRLPARRSLGIFDTDDRIDCPRTPTYPFTAVGQINVRDSSGNYVCSGTLVGPDVVLTAGHCVFSRAARAFYERLDFAPSRYRSLDGSVVNPFGVVAWKYVTLYQGYSDPTTPDPNIEDIAVITLSQPVGSQAGWMGVFEPCSPYAPSRYVALTAGYPSDQPSGSCKTTQCVVVQDPCTDGYLYHKCDTASGQSGSPMYMMAMTTSRKMGPYVRGVHNIEWVQEMPDGSAVSYINSAVSITPDHYRSILAWIGMSFTTNGTTPMGPALPPTDYMSTLSGTT